MDEKGRADANAPPGEAQLAAEQVLGRGFAYYQAGRMDDAEMMGQKALLLDPKHPVVLHFLGVLARRARKNDVALSFFQSAISIESDYGEAHYNCGNTLRDLGRLNEAEVSYERVISLQPDFVDAYYNLGLVLKDLDNEAGALSCFQKAIAIRPRFATAHNNCGLLFLSQKKWSEAVNSYKSALAIQPDYAEAHNNLGLVLTEQNKFDEAVSSYERAISLRPDYAEPHNNLGVLLNAQGKCRDAEASYNKALVLRPDYVEAHFNLGVTLEGLNQGEVARKSYLKAIEIDPDYMNAHWNLSRFYLRDHQFKCGWAGYEWGLRAGGERAHDRELPCPVWQGEGLSGKAVFVYAEQGVGDEVLFASCLTDLLELSPSQVFLECDLRLEPVFARSFPAIHVCGKIRTGSPLHTSGFGEPNYLDLCWMGEDVRLDHAISIGSLPKLFRKQITDFPKRNSYLSADDKKVSQIRTDYVKRWPGKRRIGISWRSGNLLEGSNRSLSLDLLRPVLSQPDCQFINLQYGEVAGELDMFRQQTAIDIFDDPSIDPLFDLDGFSAQLSALDLVITIDNSTAHIAGALGLPTWVLLAHEPNWRWSSNTPNGLWYSGANLYRQKNPGDWNGTVRRIEHDIDVLTRDT